MSIYIKLETQEVLCQVPEHQSEKIISDLLRCISTENKSRIILYHVASLIQDMHLTEDILLDVVKDPDRYRLPF